MMTYEQLTKHVSDYLEQPVILTAPDYIEVLDETGDMIGTLESSKTGWVLRVNGEVKEVSLIHYCW